ncbi:hypothetical protein [Mesobacillus harenae]|uniref:WYL domain-containing protein n=1 Tax=Mesobacillus harenae TaxID=2213203 RepID=UPI00158045B3|nr:hypothetical protein [Mesobacillus harenae]
MNGLLNKSIENHKPIEMIYMAANGEITQRKVIGRELKGQYFVAYCCLRQKNRTFKTSNILSVLPVKQTQTDMLQQII